MSVLTKSFRLAAVVSVFSIPSMSLAEGSKVIMEKECQITVDQGNFEVGEKIVVKKDVNGKSKKLAVARVSRLNPNGNVIAKVVSGKKNCSKLMDASVESVVQKVVTSSTERLAPMIDVTLGMGSNSATLNGMHLNSPANDPVTLALFGIKFGVDFYPFQLMGNEYWKKIMGFGINYNYLYSPQDIVISSEDANAESSKMKTVQTTMSVDLNFRFPYMSEKMATEIRFSPLFSQNHVNTLSAGNATLPIRSYKSSGMMFGMVQRLRFVPAFRLNLGFGMPLSLKGTTEELVVDTKINSTTLGAMSGLFFDASAEYLLKAKYKFLGGISRNQLKSSFAFTDESTLAMDHTDLFLYMGVGFAY